MAQRRLDAAVAARTTRGSRTEEAALDALVARSIDSFSDGSKDDGIVFYRINDGSFEASPPGASISARLAAAAKQARDPFPAPPSSPARFVMILASVEELADRCAHGERHRDEQQPDGPGRSGRELPAAAR